MCSVAEIVAEAMYLNLVSLFESVQAPLPPVEVGSLA